MKGAHGIIRVAGTGAAVYDRRLEVGRLPTKDGTGNLPSPNGSGGDYNTTARAAEGAHKSPIRKEGQLACSGEVRRRRPSTVIDRRYNGAASRLNALCSVVAGTVAAVYDRRREVGRLPTKDGTGDLSSPNENGGDGNTRARAAEGAHKSPIRKEGQLACSGEEGRRRPPTVIDRRYNGAASRLNALWSVVAGTVAAVYDRRRAFGRLLPSPNGSGGDGNTTARAAEGAHKSPIRKEGPLACSGEERRRRPSTVIDRRYNGAASCRRPPGRVRGVTLVELLVSIAILAMLLVITVRIVGSLSSTWVRMSGNVEAFAGARAGFDALSRSLRQATLKTYYAYANTAGEPVPLINPSAKTTGLDRSKIPSRYLRASDLHFLVGPAKDLVTGGSAATTPGYAVFFQAPLGRGVEPEVDTRNTLLNALGYYVEYGDDSGLSPSGVATAPARNRYRLMELVRSGEKNHVYESTLELDPVTGLADYQYDRDWVDDMVGATSSSSKYALAENIIFLALLPKLSNYTTGQGLLTTNYSYDSRWWENGYSGDSPDDERIRNQLPPLIEVVMVAIDEASAIRMQERSGGGPPLASATVKGAVDFDSLFEDPTKLDDDLAAVESGLGGLDINFRIFRTEIGLPAAKWSGEL